jgi:hypothetical protein
MYPSTQCVYDQLCDTDQDGAYPLIADTQNLFSVAHDYQVYVFSIAPLVDIVVDAVCVANIQEAAFGSSEEPRVVGYRVTLGWGVDDGEHFLQVVEYELPRGQLCS